MTINNTSPLSCNFKVVYQEQKVHTLDKMYRKWFLRTLINNILMLRFNNIIIELTHSKTIPGNPVKSKPQPAALDFQNLS